MLTACAIKAMVKVFTICFLFLLTRRAASMSSSDILFGQSAPSLLGRRIKLETRTIKRYKLLKSFKVIFGFLNEAIIRIIGYTVGKINTTELMISYVFSNPA